MFNSVQTIVDGALLFHVILYGGGFVRNTTKQKVTTIIRKLEFIEIKIGARRIY